MKPYRNEAWLRRKYVVEGLSIAAIALLCGVTLTVIHRNLVAFSIPRRPFHGRRAEMSGKWKGGRIRTTQGYIHLYSPEHPKARKTWRYVPEQVLVAEKRLGRFLSKREFIHHINEVKDDNRLENLYLFKNTAEHSRYHQKLRKGTTGRIIESNLL